MSLVCPEKQCPQPGSFLLKALRGAQAPALSPTYYSAVHPKDDGCTLHAGLGVEWCYPAPDGLTWAS